MTTPNNTSNVYSMDFETTTYADYELDGEVRCYLWHIRGVFSDDEYIGYSMREFFDWVEGLKDNTTTGWFHNVGFDGKFITDYGLRNGWTSEDYSTVKTRKLNKSQAVKVYLDNNDLKSYTRSENGKMQKTYIPKRVTADFEVPKRSMTVIKAGSRWIQLVMVNSKGKVLQLYDTGNKFTTCASLHDIAVTIGAEDKSFLDVHKRRGLDYVATNEDIERVKGDTRIVAQGIRLFYDWGMTKPTLAGDAWKIYYDMLCEKFGKDKVEKEIFPKMSEKFTFKDGYEIDLRDAYFGGRVYLRPQYADKDIEGVSNIDCNSMHPSQMRYMPMPYGRPVLSVGEPLTEHYVVSFSCVYDIKKGMDPTVQRMKSFRSIQAEWVYHSDRAGETLVMTDIDLKQFLRHYNVSPNFDMIEKHYINYKTKSECLFNEYIDRFAQEKADCKKERDKHPKGSDDWVKWNNLYYKAKILQNALYGKFGQDPEKPYQWLTLDEKDKVRIEESNVADGEFFAPRSQKYLAVAVFITAWSRNSLIDTFEKIPGAIYCDTDSVYYKDNGEDLETLGIELHPTRLGAWDVEHKMEKMGRWLRAKTYFLELPNGKLEVKCGGMPAEVKEHVTKENFHVGYEFEPGTGKLLPRTVKGGVALKEVGYKISKR